MTKQEQRAAAWEAYKAIQEPAWEAYEAIQEPALKAYQAIEVRAWKAYEAIKVPARKDYKAELERIDNKPDKDIIEVDGKRYQLIK
jgi:hypothetical protein